MPGGPCRRHVAAVGGETLEEVDPLPPRLGDSHSACCSMPLLTHRHYRHHPHSVTTTLARYYTRYYTRYCALPLTSFPSWHLLPPCPPQHGTDGHRRSCRSHKGRIAMARRYVAETVNPSDSTCAFCSIHELDRARPLHNRSRVWRGTQIQSDHHFGHE